MIFTPINQNKRNFSEGQVNLIQLGIELVKRNLYNENPIAYNKYASFAQAGGIDYLTHSKEFGDRLMKSAFEKSGIPADKNTIKEAFEYQTYRKAYFSVIEEIIDNINSKNDIEEILTFADVRNLAEGDSMNVDIKAANAYFFYKTGRGKSFGQTQKYYGTNVVLTPQPAETTVSFNRKDIVANRIDWGKEISRAIRGIRSGYLSDVSTLLFSTTINPIGNKVIQTGAYSETALRTNLQLIQARNGSNNTVLYGTNLALSAVLPTNTQLQLQLGAEYMEKGYLPTAFGYKAVELPQALKADNATIIVPNSYVIGLSTDVAKPITIGISGETRINVMDMVDNATEDYVYNVKSD